MAVAAADGATDDAMTEVRGAGTAAGPALGADMAIDFPDGATLGFAMAPTLPPSEPVASVSDGCPVHALSEPATSVTDGHPPTTVGTSHQGIVPTLAPGGPIIASVSDGRPARAPWRALSVRAKFPDSEARTPYTAKSTSLPS